MSDATIVVAGASGDLGGRIASALLERDATVRALVRHSTLPDKVERLRKLGAAVTPVDLYSASEAMSACEGAACVVSALAGLRDVIVEAQTLLLFACVSAGVPRFIPSDYSIDFTKCRAGENRNLDLRREFHTRLDKAPISATTVFNGAFAELLTGQMPMISFRLRRVLYWGDGDQRLDFTTKGDTAAFTASAALDPSTPRFLRIAGDQLSARELATVVSEVTGERFSLCASAVSRCRPAGQDRARRRPRRQRTLPGLAGHAVLLQHVRGSGKARATRQRPLSGHALDDRAGRAPGAPRRLALAVPPLLVGPSDA